MERVQSTGGRSGEEVPSLAPFEPAPAVPLDALARTARTPPASKGDEALEALHRALAELTPTEAHGALLLELLEQGAFHDLRAADGTLSRELAIAALLRLGYPWALRVHPDDLAWFRDQQIARSRFKWLIGLGLLSVGALAAAALSTLF